MNELLSIDISNAKVVADISPFYFVDSKYKKFRQNRHYARISAGLPIKIADSNRSGISVALKKHRTDAFAAILLDWKTLKPIKTALIPSLYSDRNHKIIFKLFESRYSYLLIYQECISQLEIRCFLSLKTKKSFKLLTICQSLGIESQFQEMRVCIDAIYMPCRGDVLMCLNNMIVQCEEETKPTVLYKFENPKSRDRFLSLRWACQQNVLFAETTNSIMLFQLGKEGILGIKVYQHPWLQHCNSRIVDWDPLTSLVISARRERVTREDVYIFHYSENEMKLLGYVKDILTWSISYSAPRKQLLFVDEDFSGDRQLRTLWPLRMLEEEWRIEADDEDKLEKGEILTNLPLLVKMSPPCAARFVKDVLVVRFLL